MSTQHGKTFFGDKDLARVERSAALIAAEGTPVRINVVYDAPLGMGLTPSLEPVYLLVTGDRPCPFCDCAKPLT